jgi:hypothetical protein
MYRNLFYQKISTIWENLSTVRNVFYIGVLYVLGGICLSRDLLSTLALPAPHKFGGIQIRIVIQFPIVQIPYIQIHRQISLI